MGKRFDRISATTHSITEPWQGFGNRKSDSSYFKPNSKTL